MYSKLLLFRKPQDNDHQMATAVVNSTMHPYTSFPSFLHSTLLLPFTHIPQYQFSNKPPAIEPLPLALLWRLGPPFLRTPYSQGKEA